MYTHSRSNKDTLKGMLIYKSNREKAEIQLYYQWFTVAPVTTNFSIDETMIRGRY